LVVLYLLRYEDWTLRNAPGQITLYRFMRKLDEQTLVAALNEAAQRFATWGYAQP
jgi:hypothetical protein